MRILQINPIEVNSFARHCDNLIDDTVLIGKGTDHMSFQASLCFLPFVVDANESIVKATLRIYCKKIWGYHNATNICINNDEINSVVTEKGFYEWNVTDCIHKNRLEPFCLQLYAKPLPRCCSIKEFEALHDGRKPVLEILLETQSPSPSPDIVNIVEDCIAKEYVQYSSWTDCSTLNSYTYFIQNSGAGNVEIEVQISPDQNLICNDSETVIVNPDQVIYQEPLRIARYVRIAYKSASAQTAYIKIWYQGKR